MVELTVGGVPVATYVVDPDLDIRLGPRPYLHPVRTLGGVVVTDALCFDHPWHLGASLTMPDVNGANLWGGRSYVRDAGYVWRDDHGRITHEEWRPAADGLAERLCWRDGAGEVLLTERRRIGAHPDPRGWRLSFGYRLTAPPDQDVTLGSPASNGRTGGAGYGGFFWRAGPGPVSADTSNGSAAPRVELSVGGAYTLVFEGLAGDDRWFVRAGEYAGVCAALAFDKPLTIPAGGTLSRDLSVLIADGVLPAEDTAG
ncbi:MAG TPA: PmoA family protein [Actinoplanes sp.]|nr:PmoA family protein [Actinoplanes sp.]